MIEEENMHISYSVSYNELIAHWLETYHTSDHIMVIFDPTNHLETIYKSGIDIDELNVYEGKILTVHFLSFEDALKACHKLTSNEGPYIQIWSLGRLITDNIGN